MSANVHAPVHPAYVEGQSDFDGWAAFSDCPYPDGDPRQAEWERGFDDAAKEASKHIRGDDDERE